MENKPQIIKTIEDFILPLRLLIDKEVPWSAKLIPAGIFLLYWIIPLDFVSDFIPIVGAVDDLAVFTFCTYLLVRLTPALVLKKYQSTPTKTDKNETKVIDVDTTAKK